MSPTTSKRLLAGLAALALVVGLAGIVRGCLFDGDGESGGDGVRSVTVPSIDDRSDAPTFIDPFGYRTDQREQFERRAARGLSHVLYARALGGAEATARRVARYRKLVEQAGEDADVDPDLIEALVFLESGGYPTIVAGGGDLDAAVGLTQIVAETGQSLLRMRVDPDAAARLTRRIHREERRGHRRKAQQLRAQRRRVDQRFDPARSLAATARYLRFARGKLGDRVDLALASYHMGVGNLTDALDDYDEGRAVPYAQLYFDSTPTRHRAAYRRLADFDDESSTYWFKLLAAREIMRLHREDPERLRRTARAQLAKNSAEELLHPPGETEHFATPAQLRDAWDGGKLRALPNAPGRLGLRRDRQMGELARLVRQRSGLYRGLRPEALAMAVYIGASVRAQSDEQALTITSTVRDQAYQRALGRRNREATHAYSLHTTGYAFDVSRRYDSRGQALAFQFVLDRLQALDLIAWVREPTAIHVTVGKDAKAYLPLLERYPVEDDPPG